MVERIPIVILGGGGHAAVVRNCIDHQRHEPIGCLDDVKPIGTKIGAGKVIGRFQDLSALLLRRPGLLAIVALGDNSMRQRVVNEVESRVPGVKWATAVHASAIVSPQVQIGPGTVVSAGTIINCGTRLGSHVLINTGSIIEHDNIFDDFSSTGPGVSTGGNVSVGRLSHIGIGATVRHGIGIGSNSVIGGQAFVERNVGTNLVCFGIPARPQRTRLTGAVYL